MPPSALVRLARHYLFESDTSPEQEEAFRRYIQETGARLTIWVCVSLALVIFVTWPLDLLPYPGDALYRRTINGWRTACLLPIGAGVAALLLFRPLRKAPFLVVTGMACVAAAGVGRLFGDLWGTDAHWFYTLLTLPILTTLLVGLTLPGRVLSILAITGAGMGSYFLPHPEHLRYPYLWGLAVFLLGLSLATLAGGHLLHHLIRSNFFIKLELEREKARAEGLLLNVLPLPVASRLKAGEAPIADGIGTVTVLFSDIVRFTPLARRLPPGEVVNVLNHIFSRFDHLAEKYGLEKIKTVGDAYMVVGGLPVPRRDHVSAVARMALEMNEIVSTMERPGGGPLQLRTGIHMGPVVAGVIGTTKFLYDVWGDTVNTASRMESHGVPGRIQVTRAVRNALEGEFRFERRGRIEVKGAGAMVTYFLEAPREARA